MNAFLIYEDLRKYLAIYEEAVLVVYHFATDPFWYPYIWGEFYFIFYQCTVSIITIQAML